MSNAILLCPDQSVMVFRIQFQANLFRLLLCLTGDNDLISTLLVIDDYIISRYRF